MSRSTKPYVRLLAVGLALLVPTAGTGAAELPPPLAGTAWVLAGLPGRALPAGKIEDGRLQLVAMGGDVLATLAPQPAK